MKPASTFFLVALLALTASGALCADAPVNDRDTSAARKDDHWIIEEPFFIRQEAGVDWLVNPAGNRFFSMGVCCVNSGIAREKFDTSKPSYAAWQHYADSNQWAEATLMRLKSWGFTTIGGWSEFGTLTQRPDARVAFTPVLHVGSTAGAPWLDMWDPKIIERMEQVARDEILAVRDDPRLLGYYSDNEVGWWNDALFRIALEQAPTSGQRRRLLKLLRQTYHSEWSELLKDFDPEGAGSFPSAAVRNSPFPSGRNCATKPSGETTRRSCIGTSSTGTLPGKM